MNRLLAFPMAMLFLLTIIIFLATSLEPESTTGDFSTSDTFIVEGTENQTVGVNIPSAESATFNPWGFGGFMVILTAIIAIGIVAGIKVLGSGLGELAHKILFISLAYLALWGCLSIATGELFFTTTISMVLWFVLTIMYMIGFISTITGTESV